MASRVHRLHLLAVSVLVKLLLFPTSPSTDYDVHLHWKCITRDLPLSQWYTETSSQWTLDYPPLFAYFEYLLSHLPLRPHLPTFSFMRFTVILLDPLLFYAACTYSNSLSSNYILPIALILLSPGLYLIDAVHFQYNALPLSFLLLSLSALNNRKHLLAAFLFSLTLNLKHTFLPIAPSVAVYILSTTTFSNLPLVAFATCATFTSLWFPFYSAGGLPLLKQIFNRLFPFDRGLFHAYWAPNFWALYAIVDKLAVRFGLPARHVDVDITKGIIGAQRPFAVLPNPTPRICASIMLAIPIPLLISLYKQPRKLSLVAALSALIAFLFGWHVHEKAVLVALLPLLGLMGGDENVAQGVLWISVGGQYGLFPLVTESGVLVYKYLHFILFHVVVLGWMEGKERKRGLWGYLMGCLIVEAYVVVGHGVLLGERMQFVPLLLVSAYSACGIVVGFVQLMAKAAGG